MHLRVQPSAQLWVLKTEHFILGSLTCEEAWSIQTWADFSQHLGHPSSHSHKWTQRLWGRYWKPCCLLIPPCWHQCYPQSPEEPPTISCISTPIVPASSVLPLAVPDHHLSTSNSSHLPTILYHYIFTWLFPLTPDLSCSTVTLTLWQPLLMIPPSYFRQVQERLTFLSTSISISRLSLFHLALGKQRDEKKTK